MIQRRVRSLLIAGAVGAVNAGIATGSVPAMVLAQGAAVTLLGYQATAPAAWIVRKPSSSRLAEFTIPGPDFSIGADVVVYYFGAMQGGNVDANLARWRGQFSTTGSAPTYDHVTRDSSGAFPIAIAEYLPPRPIQP